MVQLRTVRLRDLPLFLRMLKDPLVYQPLGMTKPGTLPGVLAWFLRVLAGAEGRVWTIEHQGTAVGHCRLTDWRRTGRTELGIVVDRPYWRRGIGEAACRLLIAEAPADVWLMVLRDNAVALRLYQRLGFEEVARSGRHICMRLRATVPRDHARR